ncbi:MAG: hypothetical protein ACU0CA_17285 [Paracoccaceae bacterium]
MADSADIHSIFGNNTREFSDIACQWVNNHWVFVASTHATSLNFVLPRFRWKIFISAKPMPNSAVINGSNKENGA